ncbi:hypothetical protein ACFJIX_25605 [Roseateles sp. UC29_93]|uniref:hypothetical protein n=1 Tax=Roseateles sp. UC29_93 TaxID=3350177 RepID=UPI00367335AB
MTWLSQAALSGGTDQLNGLAWLLATCPDAKLRNADKAITLSSRALRQAQQESPGEAPFMLLDTHAAAYAAAGEFLHAVDLQREAIAGLPKDLGQEERRGYQQRLQAYQARRAWLDFPTRPGR